MAAPSHPRAPRRPATGGVDMRLPWWALALPALAFAALLLFVSDSGADSDQQRQPVSQLVQRVQQGWY